MSKPGINQKSTKLQNKSLVLKTICTNADITRIDIAKKTGLSKMSITNIVNELIEERYVIDRNDKLVTNSVGRNPIILSPDLSYHTVLGLYISRDFITGIITGLNCEILYQIQVEVSSDETGTTFIDKIKDLVSRLIRTARRRKNIFSVSVSQVSDRSIWKTERS